MVDPGTPPTAAEPTTARPKARHGAWAVPRRAPRRARPRLSRHGAGHAHLLPGRRLVESGGERARRPRHQARRSGRHRLDQPAGDGRPLAGVPPARRVLLSPQPRVHRRSAGKPLPSGDAGPHHRGSGDGGRDRGGHDAERDPDPGGRARTRTLRLEHLAGPRARGRRSRAGPRRRRATWRPSSARRGRPAPPRPWPCRTAGSRRSARRRSATGVQHPRRLLLALSRSTTSTRWPSP